MNGGYKMSETKMRQQALRLIQSMIDDHIISTQDLLRFQTDTINIYEPEYIRNEMEKWYINYGIETILKKKFTLDLPHFTKAEIQEAYESGDMIICLPKGITRKQLSELFHMNTWAATNEFVRDKIEIEDFWFQTKISTVPEYLDKTASEIKAIFARENKLAMSLERYMVFVERMRSIYRKLPDQKYKTWLLNSKYENSAVLIAGQAPNQDFSVHAWMNNFHSPMVGGRYVIIPDHI